MPAGGSRIDIKRKARTGQDRLEGQQETKVQASRGDKPGAPVGPTRQVGKGHASNLISSHAAFSMPGPGYARPAHGCRPPQEEEVRICGPDVTEAMVRALVRVHSQHADPVKVLAPGGVADWKIGVTDNHSQIETDNNHRAVQCPTNCGEFTRTLCGRCVLADWPGNFALGLILETVDPGIDYVGLMTKEILGVGYGSSDLSSQHAAYAGVLSARRVRDSVGAAASRAGRDAYSSVMRAHSAVHWGGTLLPPGLHEAARASASARSNYWINNEDEIISVICEGMEQVMRLADFKFRGSVISHDGALRPLRDFIFPPRPCAPCPHNLSRTGDLEPPGSRGVKGLLARIGVAIK